jgi:hypothetical protein
MDQQRPRWRFRISTRMLLILVVGLGIAIIYGLPEEAGGRGGGPPVQGVAGVRASSLNRSPIRPAAVEDACAETRRAREEAMSPTAKDRR